MCSSLRHAEIKRNRDGKVGDKFTIRPANKTTTHESTWDGFARFESLNKYTSQGWSPIIVSGVDGFYEKHFYPLGTSRRIAGIERNNTFKIITRPAKGLEKRVHNRWPAIMKVNTI